MLTATLDKPSYNAGDIMKLTVVRSGGTQAQPGSTLQMTGTVTGSSGDSAPFGCPIVFPAKPGESLSMADSVPHTWTVVSDDGTTAIYSTIA